VTASRTAAALALVALSALVAGCGSDDDEKAAPAATTTLIQTVTNQQPRTAAAKRETAVRQIKTVTGFSSPSKNIGCFIDSGNVRCDIRKRSWKPPRKPRTCELDYGQGINLSAGMKPAFVCAGDTALGPPTKLAYGKAIAAGSLRCDSKRSGMTCRDSKTTHGFSISRERVRRF